MAENTTVDNGALADFVVSSEELSDGSKLQSIELHTESGGVKAKVDGANPLRVSARRRGTADYDSGMFDVATPGPALVTAATIYPEGGVIVNNDVAPHDVTITDGADAVKARMNIQGLSTLPIPIATSGEWAGWKVGADGAGVRCQVAGSQ